MKKLIGIAECILLTAVFGGMSFISYWFEYYVYTVKGPAIFWVLSPISFPWFSSLFLCNLHVVFAIVDWRKMGKSPVVAFNEMMG